MKIIVKILVISLTCFHHQLSIARNQGIDAERGEKLGEAYANLMLKPRIVSGILDKCSASNSDFSALSKTTLETWNERNRKYLGLAEGIEEEIDDYARQGAKPEMLSQLRDSIANSTKQIIGDFTESIDGLQKDEKLNLCTKIASAISLGSLDVSGSAQSKHFLDNLLLDEASSNLSIEIEIPADNDSNSQSIKVKVQELITGAGKSLFTSEIIERNSQRKNLVRIDFVRHFSRKEGLPLADQIFDSLNKNLPKNVPLRVHLKIRGIEKKLERITP